MKKNRYQFLLSPWTIILGIVTGIIIGIYFKGIVIFLSPIGKAYISLLKMCILPIVASAIIVSLSKLLRSHETSQYINKILTIFCVFLLGIAFIGLFVGFVSIPLIGDDADMRKTIGQLMIDKKIDTRYQEVQSKGKAGLADFLINIIPQNIFTALSKNQTPKIIFFFIMLGVMIKFVSEKAGDSIIMLSEGIFEAFQALIKFIMYFLPLGLCALLSDQVSQIGFAVLGSLVKLIVIIYVSALLVFILSTLIIWRYSGGSYFRQYIALKDAIVIAIGTRSSFPTLPSAISGLCDGLNLNKERTHLTVPLGFSLCKYGKILVFCIGAVFAAHLYNYSLGIEGILIIVISSILAGMAASGAPSIVSRSMISMVLLPLGIPPEAIIVILLTIDPIVDPIITLINTYPNYAATAMIAGRKAEI